MPKSGNKRDEERKGARKEGEGGDGRKREERIA
jgi:hypothetical protein